MIRESVSLKQSKLVIPAFTKGREQLDPIGVEKNKSSSKCKDTC